MQITAEITPQPLARPRINTTNRGRYLPSKCKNYLDEPIKTPCAVTIEFYKPLKVTAPKYRDIDNLAKAVLDAGNGILWQDDRQIYKMTLQKYKGEGKITIEVIENE